MVACDRKCDGCFIKCSGLRYEMCFAVLGSMVCFVRKCGGLC